MIKKLITILLICLLFCNITSVLAEEKDTEYIQTLRSIQTKTYADTDIQTIKTALVNSLKNNNYEITYQDDNINYITASKSSPVRDVQKSLLFIYAGKTVFDSIMTVLTYGLRGYSLVGDVMLFKTEFKDKNLENKIAINIEKSKNDTIVRINIVKILTGKRDFLIVGPKNRLATTHIETAKEYEEFFSNLDKEVYLQKENNIKTGCIKTVEQTHESFY